MVIKWVINLGNGKYIGKVNQFWCYSADSIQFKYTSYDTNTVSNLFKRPNINEVELQWALQYNEIDSSIDMKVLNFWYPHAFWQKIQISVVNTEEIS